MKCCLFNKITQVMARPAVLATMLSLRYIFSANVPPAEERKMLYL